MKSIKTFAAIASAMALCTVSCLSENPVERHSADGDKPAAELTAAARSPIGSTLPVTNISTLAQLRAMNTTGNYKLVNNINASATAATPFVPIGAVKDPFRGTFDGGNFTISNLTVTGGTQTGMFMWAVGADFKNIRLVDVNITGGANTGAIAGYAQNVDLKNSYVTGTVTGNNAQGNSKLGMFFGSTSDFVRIERCYATGTVTGWGKYVGGIVGYGSAQGVHNPDPAEEFLLKIDEVFTNVNVNPTMPAGNGAIYAGGLVGYVNGGWIEDVHSMGPVTGRTAAGGLLGYVFNTDPLSKRTVLRGAMTRSIVTDAATPNRAGTIGMSTGTFAWCSSFWDNQADGGIANPSMPEPSCQTGMSSNDLKAAHPSPNKVLTPYIFGMHLTQQAIDQYGFDQCMLGSGSDGDWGFGTCGTTQVWAANSSTEYNTLTRIPNPGVQPK